MSVFDDIAAAVLGADTSHHQPGCDHDGCPAAATEVAYCADDGYDAKLCRRHALQTLDRRRAQHRRLTVEPLLRPQ